LNPGPPDLKDVGKEDNPGQIFWVVKHGIKMTGMPSFAKAGVADNEIWKIVAFIKKLPAVSEADYKAWTAPPAAPAAVVPPTLPAPAMPAPAPSAPPPGQHQ
jgi:hypothetical protein